MQIHDGALPASPKLSVDYAQCARTTSTSHGGFDNDAATLSAIMARIMARPARPPTKEELTGY